MQHVDTFCGVSGYRGIHGIRVQGVNSPSWDSWSITGLVHFLICMPETNSKFTPENLWLEDTLPETNSHCAPENRPGHKRKLVF